ncbi:MAG: ABC transporter substrate-binding protein [Acetobacteraceae bacterium]
MAAKWLSVTAAALLGTALTLGAAHAQKKPVPGVTDTTIKIGNTMPYSGPASGYGPVGRSEAAYFKMINDQGGINGRKIDFTTLDDGYSPPKTVEQTRRLVEQDNVLAVFGSIGTPTNTAVHQYLNSHKVPQLLVMTGATKWNDPKHFPWTIGFLPSYQAEGRIYAKYILQNIPDAKIGILYQNDDFGKDYLKGVHDGLGAEGMKKIVKEVSYETTDPTIESQIIELQAAGANVFINITIPKMATQAIRKAADIGWHPTQFLVNVSNSISSALKPAGLDKSTGIISTLFVKDPADPRWKDDAEMQAFLGWLAKYQPDANKADLFNVWGYSDAALLVQLLKQCGDDLSRENVMKQAAAIHHFHIPMTLPGMEVNTTPDDWAVIDQLQLEKFDGKVWVPFGSLIMG